ncbi:MAG: hypothetical protein ACP5OK_04485 [Thermoprotei archaeon]
MSIFERFKQLNIFKRNKVPFELKVLSILMHSDSAQERQQNYSHSQNKKSQKQAYTTT